MSRVLRLRSPLNRCFVLLGLLWAGHPGPIQSAYAQPAAAESPASPANSASPARLDEPPPQGYLPDGSLISERVAIAREQFAAGKYSEAATILSLVIAVEPRPIHVFNLGQSQRRAGQIEGARKSYQRFMELAPEHPSVPEAVTYIRELDLIAAQVVQAEKAYRSQLDRTRSDLLAQLDRTRGELLSERAQVAALRRDRPLYKRAWFWGVLGGTLTAATVVAVTAGVLATRPPEPPPTDTGYIGFPF